MSIFQNSRWSRGWSFVEMICVMVVVSVMSVWSVSAWRGLTKLEGKRGGISQVLSLLSRGRALALQEGYPVDVVFVGRGVGEGYEGWEFRAMSLVMEGEEGAVYASRWELLPAGVRFKDEALSLLGAEAKEFAFPHEGGEEKRLAYVRFDEMGRVEMPQEEEKLRLYVGESVMAAGGGRTGSGTMYEEIRISGSTGLARWMSGGGE